MVLLLLFLASANACHGEYFMIQWDPNKKNFGNKNKSDSDYSDEQSQRNRLKEASVKNGTYGNWPWVRGCEDYVTRNKAVSCSQRLYSFCMTFKFAHFISIEKILTVT